MDPCFIPDKNNDMSLAFPSLALRSLGASNKGGKISAQTLSLCSIRVIRRHVDHQIPCRESLWLSKEQYKDQSPFYVPSRLGERLMIPTKYVEELKSAPVHEVDFVGTFFEVGFRLEFSFENESSANERYQDVRGQVHNHGQ